MTTGVGGVDDGRAKSSRIQNEKKGGEIGMGGRRGDVYVDVWPLDVAIGQRAVILQPFFQVSTFKCFGFR